LVHTGFRHYHSMCVMCHGAPGRDPSEVGQGLNPQPPPLDADQVQTQYSDAELYWIIKHGVRMTGMPAFGPTHTEKDLWALVAFVRTLPQITPDEYTAMAQTAADGHGVTTESGHPHTHSHQSQPGSEKGQHTH
jgi:mono/diheme cytochrome c family protein